MAYIGQTLTEGTRREYTYVATAGQTTFNAVYTVGAVDVFQNGVLLQPSDYTATDGTTVVLGTGAALDDEITIHCHNTFSVADTVSASQGGTFNNDVTVSGDITANQVTANGFVIGDNILSLGYVQADEIRMDGFGRINYTDADGKFTLNAGLEASGNVGIGREPSTVAKVSIRRDDTTDYSDTVYSAPSLYLQNGASNTGGFSGMEFGAQTDNGTSVPWSIGAVAGPAGTYNSDFVFKHRTGSTTYAETLRLTAAGETVSSGHMYSSGGASYLQGTSVIRPYSSLSLSTTATDVYVASQGLIPSGTYILQVYLSGSAWYTETWVGIMRWYNNSTNSGNATDIYMTGMGHAPNNQVLYARVLRRGSNQLNQAIQLWSNVTTTPSVEVAVKRLM